MSLTLGHPGAAYPAGKSFFHICSTRADAMPRHLSGHHGKIGIRKIAQINHDQSSLILKAGLESAGFSPLSDAPFFNEFVVKAPAGFAARRAELITRTAYLPAFTWETITRI